MKANGNGGKKRINVKKRTEVVKNGMFSTKRNTTNVLCRPIILKTYTASTQTITTDNRQQKKKLI
jgi:hypothetical protein